jgi:hypothetical protein
VRHELLPDRAVARVLKTEQDDFCFDSLLPLAIGFSAKVCGVMTGQGWALPPRVANSR